MIQVKQSDLILKYKYLLLKRFVKLRSFEYSRHNFNIRFYFFNKNYNKKFLKILKIYKNSFTFMQKNFLFLFSIIFKFTIKLKSNFNLLNFVNNRFKNLNYFIFTINDEIFIGTQIYQLYIIFINELKSFENDLLLQNKFLFFVEAGKYLLKINNYNLVYFSNFFQILGRRIEDLNIYFSFIYIKYSFFLLLFLIYIYIYSIFIFTYSLYGYIKTIN